MNTTTPMCNIIFRGEPVYIEPNGLLDKICFLNWYHLVGDIFPIIVVLCMVFTIMKRYNISVSIFICYVFINIYVQNCNTSALQKNCRIPQGNPYFSTFD